MAKIKSLTLEDVQNLVDDKIHNLAKKDKNKESEKLYDLKNILQKCIKNKPTSSDLKLTIKETLKLHKELWEWASKNPDKYLLEEYPEWKANGGTYDRIWANNFCCQYVKQFGVKNGAINCNYCPLVWPGGKCQTKNMGGLVAKWQLETNKNKKADYAKQIKNLPAKRTYH